MLICIILRKKKDVCVCGGVNFWNMQICIARQICAQDAIVCNKAYFEISDSLIGEYPANISMSDQRWNNVDPTLKMKQNPTSDFQRCTTLIKRQCPTLKQRRNNVTQCRNNVAQRWYDVDTTLFQPSVDKIQKYVFIDSEPHAYD